MSRTTKINSFFVKPTIIAESMTLTEFDSGKTYFLNSAGGFTMTLPVPKPGLNFRFIVKTAPTTEYIIASSGSANVIGGQVLTSDTNAAVRTSVQLPGVETVRFAANVAKVGDTLELVSDGTYWYGNGFCAVVDGIRFIEQSASPSVSPSISTSRSPSRSPSASPSISPSISPSPSS